MFSQPNQNPFGVPMWQQSQYVNQYPVYNPQGGNQQQGRPENYNNQLLTPEQMKELRAKPNNFNTKLTYEEACRSICSHKDENRNISLETIEPTEHGHNCRCAMCSAEFRLLPENTPIEEINRICDNFLNLLHSAKAYMCYTPQEFKDFYLMVGMVPKVSDFWKIAVSQFNRSYNDVNKQQMNQGPDGNTNAFNTLGQFFGGGAFGGGFGYNQPFQSAPQQYPQYQQQYNTFGQPVDANGNTYNPNVKYDAFGRPMPTQAPAMGVFNQSAPQQQPMPSANPIGYVDTNTDFTMQSQNNTVAPQMPGPNTNAGTQQVPPMPEPPKNPNVVDNGAATTKAFPG